MILHVSFATTIVLAAVVNYCFVFCCRKFFERIILCNSLVWTCAYTGRSGLTFEEAVDSEKKAKEQLEHFPQYLQRPLLCVASLTHRSRLIDMNDDVFLFAKDRYFVDEAVEVVISSQRLLCHTFVFYILGNLCIFTSQLLVSLYEQLKIYASMVLPNTEAVRMAEKGVS